MLQAHLAWAEAELPGVSEKLQGLVGEESRMFLSEALLATQWIPFYCFMEIDRASSSSLRASSTEETAKSNRDKRTAASAMLILAAPIALLDLWTTHKQSAVRPGPEVSIWD